MARVTSPISPAHPSHEWPRPLALDSTASNSYWLPTESMLPTMSSKHGLAPVGEIFLFENFWDTISSLAVSLPLHGR